MAIVPLIPSTVSSKHFSQMGSGGQTGAALCGGQGGHSSPRLAARED